MSPLKKLYIKHENEESKYEIPTAESIAIFIVVL